jgi:hypothetical protein
MSAILDRCNECGLTSGTHRATCSHSAMRGGDDYESPFEDTYAHNCAYWLGRLSMAAALTTRAIKNGYGNVAEKDMRRTLDEFLRSPVPSEELKTDIRENLR